MALDIITTNVIIIILTTTILIYFRHTPTPALALKGNPSYFIFDWVRLHNLFFVQWKPIPSFTNSMGQGMLNLQVQCRINTSSTTTNTSEST